MLSIAPPRPRSPFALGQTLGNIVGGNGVMPPFPTQRITRREFGAHDAPERPGGLLHAAIQPGLDGMPDVLDNSPPGLPPMNMPGGNEPTPLRGIVSGYGGGTWNADGSVATPVDRPGDGSGGTDRTDYAALLQNAIGPAPKMSTGQKIASVIGPMLMAASGNQAGATQMIQALQSRRDDYSRRQQDAAATAIKWGREDDLEAAKRNEPQYWSGSDDRVRFDPATGTATRVYDAPRDFEDYAAAGGFEYGTPEYFQAVEDHVLRGNGPTAFKYDRDLEAVKNAQRITLEAERQRNRSALRGMPSYRDLNPPPPRASGPRGKARPTATGPNGQKLEYDGKAWVPAR